MKYLLIFFLCFSVSVFAQVNSEVPAIRSIMNGIPSTDMIPWSQVCSNEQGYALTDFILENQKDTPIELRPIPSQIETQDYWVKVETLAREGFIPPLGQLN